MQIFLRHDRSLTLDVDAADTIAGVKGALAAKTGLPADEMRLVCEGKLLQDVRTLAEHSVAHHATLHVVFGLRGGKGGFGAMLRTAGTRGVKTTNFDACRDLNGRRLRHVNAEAQLREWDAQAEERKLKKQQQTALNAKPTGPPPIARFDDDEYDEMLEVCWCPFSHAARAHTRTRVAALGTWPSGLNRRLTMPPFWPCTQGTRSRVTDALAAGLASSSAEGASSSGGGGGGADGAASDEVATSGPAAPGTSSTHPPAQSKAEGKRKAVPPPAATSAPAKAAKLNVAFDPLAGLGGSGSEDDDDDDDEAAAGGQ